MLRRCVSSILFLFVLGLSSYSNASSVVTEQATVDLAAGEYANDGNVVLGLHFKLEKGWKIYWRDPGDTGFPPKLDWSGSKNIKSMNMLWPAPERQRYKIIDDLYNESYEYSDEVLFPLEFTPNDSTKEVNINLNVDYAICNEICIPAHAEFNINVPPNFKSEENLILIEKFKSHVPKENGTNGVLISSGSIGQEKSGEQYFQVAVHSDSVDLKNASIFIEGGESFAFYNPSSFLNSNMKEVIFNVPLKVLDDNSNIKNGIYKITLANGKNSVEREISGGELGIAVEVYSKAKSENKIKYSKLVILLFAFIGGLILNVMPCVLPVLSIKLLGVIKHGGGNKLHVASSFLVTALGIVVSFVILGSLVFGLRTFGVNVGWGFNFQEPLFIISLVVILSLFAANMWGFYEFRLPTISDKAFKKSAENNHMGHFLTGVLATVLATPCTAPFLGTAVGFALTGSFVEIILVFLMMGLGMSLPYLVFSLFPHVVTKLPKPGHWMVVVKNIMGGFIAVTAIWLIWVLSHQLGYFSAAALSTVIMLIFLKLRLKVFKHRNLSIVVFIILILAAFITPLQFAKNRSIEGERKINGIWQEFKVDEIAKLVGEGEVVFVDVTADWCLTCKVNKFFVLDSDEIIEQFKTHDVVAMQADWTNRNEKIGNYLARYNRVGIPFNIIYGPSAPDGIVMSELLSKEDVVNSLKIAKGK